MRESRTAPVDGPMFRGKRVSEQIGVFSPALRQRRAGNQRERGIREVNMDYAVELQEVEKAKETYKQKVALLRAAMAVNSNKDEYDDFEDEFNRATENRMDAHEGDKDYDYRDDKHLDDEEEVLKWVLRSRAEFAADSATEAAST